MGDPVPRIYVASLADYNAGRLHGCWIVANQSPDDIYREIQEMLSASEVPNAEEWAIHDFEGFGDHRVDESARPATVVRTARLALAEAGSNGSGSQSIR